MNAREAIDSAAGGRCLLTGLALIILVLAAYGVRQYNALLSADSWTYLRYAQALSRGTVFDDPEVYSVFRPWWPSVGRLDLSSGLRHMIDQRIYFGYEPGFPLLLAAVIRLVGLPAVYFVNPVLLLALVLFAFLAFRRIFPFDPDRDRIAFFGVAVMLLIPPLRMQSSAVKVLRDIPAVTCMVLGVYALLRGCQSRPLGKGSIFLAGFCLGFASLVRFNYLPGIGPFALFLALVLNAQKSGWREALRAGAALFLGLATIGVFILCYDSVQNRDFLYTLRKFVHIGRMFTGSGSGLFSVRNFARVGQWYLDFLGRAYSPGLIAIALIGLAADLRQKPVVFLLVPLAILQMLVFSSFIYKSPRYLLPVYFVLAVLIARGTFLLLRAIDFAVERFPARSRRRLVARLLMAVAGTAMIALCVRPHFRLADIVPAVLGADLLLSAVVLRSWRRLAAWFLSGIAFVLVLAAALPGLMSSHRFQIADVDRLRRECERLIPPGSLVFATGNLKQNIDLYTSSVSLTPYQLAAPWRLKPEVAVRVVLETGIPVFAFDNQGTSDARVYLDELRDYFDATPVAAWKSRDLNVDYPGVSERDDLQLYRITTWKQTGTTLVLEEPMARDRLLAILPRRLWWDADRQSVEAFLDGRPLRGAVTDDLTFVFLKGEWLSRPSQVLRLVSDRGLPGSIGLAFSCDPSEGLLIDMGRRTKKGFPDQRFPSEGFSHESRSGSYRTIQRRARMLIPAVSPAGYVSRVKIKARGSVPEGSTPALDVALDGRRLGRFDLPAAGSWGTVEALLPVCDQEVGSAWLEMALAPRGEEAAADFRPDPAGRLDIDWLSIGWTAVSAPGSAPAPSASTEVRP